MRRNDVNILKTRLFVFVALGVYLSFSNRFLVVAYGAQDSLLSKVKVKAGNILNELYHRNQAETEEIEIEDYEIEAAEAEIIKTPMASTTNYSILVNKYNPIDREFVPSSTINIANFVKTTKSEILLEDAAANAYIEMAAAIEADGIYNMAAVSGYRTFNYQTSLYNAQVKRQMNYYAREQAEISAARVVAYPGTSEHQLGLALDVSSKDIGYSLSESFKNTQAYSWLFDNSYKYGYIIRYEEDKSDITGIIYEPWHLRYVGREMAAEIYESGLCLEEYIEQINR